MLFYKIACYIVTVLTFVCSLNLEFSKS